MNRLEGKTALITGGASGIGLAISQALVKAGMRVALCSRRKALLKEQVEALNKEHPGHAIAVETDVREKLSVENAVAEVASQFGQIDVLVNNAGLGVTHLIEDCPEEDWDLVLDTTTKGTFLMTQAVLPHMKAQQDGFVINIASQAAKNGYERAGPYCAAKFAVLGLGLALQEEVRAHGIKVHSLCPGLVQVPAPKDVQEMKEGWLQTEDMAQAVLYLLQQPKRVFIENIGLYGF